MRSKADETLVIVETLICPLQISDPYKFSPYKTGVGNLRPALVLNVARVYIRLM